LRLLVSLLQDGIGDNIEIDAGREAEFFFEVGTFLDAGGVVVGTQAISGYRLPGAGKQQKPRTSQQRLVWGRRHTMCRRY
jgi:hypothetical protein